MWSAITQVTTGFTLIAFLVAVSAWVYRSSLIYRTRLIESMPPSDRAPLVERALDLMLLDSAGLTREQKYLLARQQIAARERRLRAAAVVGALIAVLLAALAAYAISRMSGESIVRAGVIVREEGDGERALDEVRRARLVRSWCIVRRNDPRRERTQRSGFVGREPLEGAAASRVIARAARAA